MKISAVIGFAVFIGAALSGCVPMADPYQPAVYQPPPPQGYYAPPPQPYQQPSGYRRPALNSLQQEALGDGCQMRHRNDSGRVHRCMEMEGDWREALAEGCQHRYSGNGHKLKECMQY